MRYFRIVLAVCLACSLGLAEGCSDDRQGGDGAKPNADKANAVASAMKYAPPGAVGVVHIDFKALAGDVLVELRKHKDQLEGMSDAELDQAAATVAKIDSLDMFFAKGPAEPKFIGVFRTLLAPADMAILKKLASEPVTLVKAANGRYDNTKGGTRMIFGAEADDLDSGIMLVGPLDMLTPEFVAKLGRGDNATLLALLGEIDTSRPLWAAVGLEFVPARDAPAKILASLDPRGSGSGSGTIVFKSEKGAVRAAEEIAGFQFSTECDGATLTIQFKGSGPFIPRVLEAMFKARQKARQMVRETISMANLQQLATAIYNCAVDNDGKMPPDLKALEPYLDDMPKVLTSPLSKGKLPAGESDYVYIPLGNVMRIRDPTQAIMLYERLENHDGKGTLAAFLDGHVQRLDMEKFKQLLKAAQALSAKQTAPK